MACANSKGGMRIELTDAPYPPYDIVVSNNGSTVTKVTATTANPVNVVDFQNYFNDGRYQVSLENTYGCTVTQTVEIKKNNLNSKPLLRYYHL